jgi:tetratricopeptide (TPR) repeat protein
MVKTSLGAKVGLILLGLFFSVIILELGLRFAGFLVSIPQQRMNMAAGHAVGDGKREYRILAIGESTTFGGGYSWTAQLENILNERSTQKFRVYNVARAGTNTAFILERLPQYLEQYKPDMVITMMGVNDDELWFAYGRPNEDFAARVGDFGRDLRVYKLANWLVQAWKSRKLNRTLEPASEEPVLAEPIGAQCQQVMNMAVAEYTNESWAWAKVHFEELLLKCNMTDDGPYFLLSDAYKRTNDTEGAREFFRQVIKSNPDVWVPYAVLALFLTDNASRDEEKQVLLKAIELNPYYNIGYDRLASIYRSEGHVDAADGLIKKYMSLNRSIDEEPYLFDDLYFTKIGLGYRDKYPGYRLPAYFEQRGFSSVGKETPWWNITVYHYRQVYKELREQGIQLVVMQYPTVDIGILKSIFPGNKEIIFVSNKENFRIALETQPYGKLFTDDFGRYKTVFRGNYGHATFEGNRLIAENAANAILAFLSNQSSHDLKGTSDS